MKVSGALLIILFSTCLISGSAQTLNETYAYAENLKESGNYELAIKNYKRVLFFDSAYIYPQTSWQIADCFYASAQYTDALYFYQQAFNEAANDSVRAASTIMKAATNIRLHDYNNALIDIYSFTGTANSEQKFNLRILEGIVCYNVGKYKEAELNFNNAATLAGFHDTIKLEKRFKAIEKIEHRYNPKQARVMSIIIPGLGQTYSGNYVSGINSFVLTMGLLTGAVLLTTNINPVDAFLIVLPWFQRYYMGGYRNAYNLTLDKQSEKKQENLKEIINMLSKSN